MATRSNIVYFDPATELYKRIYCHYDGYLEGVGDTLVEHYNSEERAKALTSIGDVSVLAPLISCPEGHTFERPFPDCTVFYGRDRGEKNTKGTTHSSIDEAVEGHEEYLYLWDHRLGDEWHLVVNDSELVPVPRTVKAAVSAAREATRLEKLRDHAEDLAMVD